MKDGGVTRVLTVPATIVRPRLQVCFVTETYTPDGKKRVSLNMSSGQMTSSASWHDSVLVIESTLDIKIPNATVVVTGLKPIIDTWTLSADGRTLTHDAGQHKEIYVYEKQ